MVHAKKMLIILALAALLAVTWLLVVTGGPRTQAKQNELLAQAQSLIEDGVYVTAIPLLEEAALLNPKNSSDIEQRIANCYLSLNDSNTAAKRLQGIVNSGSADEAVYLQLAGLYLDGTTSKYQQALTLLKAGGEQLNSDALRQMYQENRFRIIPGYAGFQSLGDYYSGAMTASIDGKFGYAGKDGSVVFDFKFDKITDKDSSGNSFAMDGGKAVVVDSSGNRLALCKEPVEDIAPLCNGIGAVKTADGWHLSDSSFNIGQTVYEHVGRPNEGCRPVKQAGQWYLMDGEQNMLTPGLEEIMVDSSGNAFAQGRAFAKKGDRWIMIDSTGTQAGQDSYEDARPFADGAAAVKKDGKWQYISSDGSVVLTGEFEDALSFGCNLAPIKMNGLWGYVDINGKLAVECTYDEAYPFHDGVARVRMGEKWRILRLKEYEN